MLKQNRLFSSVYIVGTGLSIALVMVLFVIYYVKAGPVYPEYNRDRMLVIKTMKSQDKGSNGTSGRLLEKFVAYGLHGGA